MPVHVLLKILAKAEQNFLTGKEALGCTSVPLMLSSLQITLINSAVFFGHYVIIAGALNLQFGNAGIPNMSSNISVAIGAYTVSSVVLRASMWVTSRAGLVLKPDWVFDNPYNVNLMSAYFKNQPLLSISFVLFSIAMALILGSVMGYFIGKLSGKLRATRLMMLTLIISEGAKLIAANNEYIAGGTIGSFIPNFFGWYRGEQMVILAMVIIIVGLSCYYLMHIMLNSPFGRLMRGMRDNEMTLASTGKDIERLRSEVMMFGSGIMSVAGVLLAFYYSFVQYNMYSRVDYTFWPWLMITIGGLGSNPGGYVGTLFSVSILKALTLSKQSLGPMLIGTKWIKLITYFEDIILGGLLLAFMVFKPRGLVPEKNLVIRDVNYIDIIKGKDPPRKRTPSSPGSSRRRS
jgi:branched-chain amino acid transport system permease protein